MLHLQHRFTLPERSRNNIAAAIVDLSMPGLSGDKLVGVLRSNARLSRLVVIVVSGQSHEELERIADECEVDAVLGKRQVAARLVPLLDSLQRPESATFQRSRVVIPNRAGGQ